MMGHRMVLRTVVLIALSLSAASASASHYRLAGSGLFSKAEMAAFTKIGVTSTKALLERGLSTKARAELSRATSVSKTRISTLVQQCDLLRISGVGPTIVRLFQDAGYPTTWKLSRAKPGALRQKMAASNARLRLVPEVPDVGLLARWLAVAKGLPRIVKGIK